jgi:hypothetical protein
MCFLSQACAFPSSGTFHDAPFSLDYLPRTQTPVVLAVPLNTTQSNITSVLLKPVRLTPFVQRSVRLLQEQHYCQRRIHIQRHSCFGYAKPDGKHFTSYKGQHLALVRRLLVVRVLKYLRWIIQKMIWSMGRNSPYTYHKLLQL